MMYRVCPYCGANLDPGEPCDCREERSKYLEKFKPTGSGQMVLNFGKEVMSHGIQRKYGTR